jgi:hypothetical protein
LDSLFWLELISKYLKPRINADKKRNPISHLRLSLSLSAFIMRWPGFFEMGSGNYLKTPSPDFSPARRREAETGKGSVDLFPCRMGAFDSGAPWAGTERGISD